MIELKSVALSNTSSLPEPQKLVARLARSLDGISNASARASVFWLVGQFAAAEEKAVMGLGWEGVAPWVPDVLRKGIKGFAAEVGHPLRRCGSSAEETSQPLPSCKS